MNIISEKTLSELVGIFKFEYGNWEKFEDTILNNYLTYYRIVELEKSRIIEIDNTFNTEDLFYSEYYWFAKFKNRYFKNRYFKLCGYDEGFEQQAFKILENISIHLENGVNWAIIEHIDRSIDKWNKE